jgi:feruloyl-CoA synthase
VARQLQQAYRSEAFYQVYGMSEMGPTGTALYPREQIAKAGSIGRGGMPGVDLRVVRPDGRDAQPGETGETWLASDTRMVGYLDNDAATAEVFEGRWYRSGDVARVDEDGYLYIVDRTKDLINTGGTLVASREVEEVLFTHPSVAEVAVIAVPDPRWIEAVAAVVVLRADAAGTPPEQVERELVAHARGSLAPFKVPKRVFVAEVLPKNTAGKLLKRELRQRYAGTGDAALGRS